MNLSGICIKHSYSMDVLVGYNNKYEFSVHDGNE